MKTLFDEDVTASTDKDIGIVSTSIGFSLAFLLAMYKYEVGHKLKSMTITAGQVINITSSHSQQPYSMSYRKSNPILLCYRCDEFLLLRAHELVCSSCELLEPLFLVG